MAKQRSKTSLNHNGSVTKYHLTHTWALESLFAILHDFKNKRAYVTVIYRLLSHTHIQKEPKANIHSGWKHK